MYEFASCICCGDPIPEGVQICRRCVRKASSDDVREIQMDCKNYNEEGYFCELTGLECYGKRCFSYFKK